MKRLSYVTPEHLLDNLLKQGWFSKRIAFRNRPWKVGVCVSGGPDSMALAYLLRHMPHPFVNGVRAFSPCALIIDHGARDGSHEESLWVKHQLDLMDIDSHIWKLRWQPGTDPKSLRGFEMKARDSRYRALITLARENQLEGLFTGHHEDDQVETIMLRLLRDESLNPLSFRGMSMTSTVPTAEESWISSTHCIPYRRSESGLTEGPVSISSQQSERYNTAIRLYRPLLGCQKSQLIATCDHFSIPYVQDKTNFNPQLTFRNALRHLRTHYRLPRAMHSEMLLNLCTKANEISSKVEEQARLFLDYVLSFEMRSESGVLSLRMKTLPDPMSEAQLRGFSFFMQRVISIVSPLADQILPTMLDPERTKELYIAYKSRTPSKESSKLLSVISSQVVCTRLSYDPSSNISTFRFSRQPISSTNTTSLEQCFPYAATNIDMKGTSQCQSEWLLWDGRFWIKVHGEKAVLDETVVRPYTSSDVFAVKQLLDERGVLDSFEQIIAVNAPGHIRFTLPLLIVSGKPMAFPTLNLSIVSNPPINWQVMYPRNQRSTEFFFPQIQDGDEIMWSFGQSQLNTGPRTWTTGKDNRSKDAQPVPS